MWPHAQDCMYHGCLWKNILTQHSGMESVSFFNFVRGPLLQTRVTFICNSQTGEFCISENVWCIFLVVFYVLKSVEFSAFLNLPERLMVLSVDPATTVSVLCDEKDKAGEGRRKGMGWWYRHENLGSPRPADTAMSFVTWLQQQWPSVPMHTLAAAHTEHSQLWYCHTNHCAISLTYWYEAVLEAISGHWLTPCISSTVNIGLPASALLAQHWGFGSSDCTIWKEFSSSFSPDLFLLVFLVKERRSPLHVGAVSC